MAKTNNITSVSTNKAGINNTVMTEVGLYSQRLCKESRHLVAAFVIAPTDSTLIKLLV